jgi:hypothetical protein
VLDFTFHHNREYQVELRVYKYGIEYVAEWWVNGEKLWY